MQESCSQWSRTIKFVKGPFFSQPYQPRKTKETKFSSTSRPPDQHPSSWLINGRRKHYIMLRGFWIKGNRNIPSLLLFSKNKAVRLDLFKQIFRQDIASLWNKARQKRESKIFHQLVLFFSEILVDMVDMVDLVDQKMDPWMPPVPTSKRYHNFVTSQCSNLLLTLASILGIRRFQHGRKDQTPGTILRQWKSNYISKSIYIVSCLIYHIH